MRAARFDSARRLEKSIARRRLGLMSEEARPEAAFGLRGQNENIWHIAAAERWSDGQIIGHRTYCGRNYPDTAHRPAVDTLTEVCSDCTAQVANRH